MKFKYRVGNGAIFTYALNGILLDTFVRELIARGARLEDTEITLEMLP